VAHSTNCRKQYKDYRQNEEGFYVNPGLHLDEPQRWHHTNTLEINPASYANFFHVTFYNIDDEVKRMEFT
jgi:hypothetical protein